MIEKGVPVPKPNRGKWAFINDMVVGDSIFVQDYADYEKARYSMINYCKKNDWRYISRKEPDGSGWRLWRTE